MHCGRIGNTHYCLNTHIHFPYLTFQSILTISKYSAP